MSIEPQYSEKSSDRFSVFKKDIRKEWAEKREEKRSKIAKIALAALAAFLILGGVAFTAVAFVLAPPLWPAGLVVAILGVAALAGYCHVEVARPFRQHVEFCSDSEKKDAAGRFGLDLPIKKKTNLHSKTCLDRHGLDVPADYKNSRSTWDFFDPNGVTFVENPKGSESLCSIIRKTSPVKYLVCEGGGAKGIAYPSFLKGLNRETNFLENLEEIAGTSAGSLAASLLAAGMSIKELDHVISTTDLSQYLGKSDKKAIQGALPLAKWKGWYPATKLAEFIQEKFYQSIKKYYDSLDREAQQAMETKFGDEFQKLEEGVTFKHLKWLHELDPKKFKRLHVVAFGRNSKKPRYYNDENTPDRPVFFAVRCSISIPLVFKPVRGEDGEVLSDGGEASNGPSEIFTRREGYHPAHLVRLIFDRNGEAFDIMHKKEVRGVIHAVMDLAMQIFVGRHYVEAEERDRKKIRKLGHHALVVPHGDLGTLGFSPDKEKIKHAKKIALEAGRQYGRYLRDEAVSDAYATVEDACTSLNRQEMLAVYTSAACQQALKTLDRSSPKHRFYMIVLEKLCKDTIRANATQKALI